MNLTEGSAGSGGPDTYVSGWILAFYGKSRKTDAGKIGDDYAINVSVKLDNQITGISKNVILYASFRGLIKTDGSYRPQLSMIVYEEKDMEEEKKKKEEEEERKKEERRKKWIKAKEEQRKAKEEEQRKRKAKEEESFYKRFMNFFYGSGGKIPQI